MSGDELHVPSRRRCRLRLGPRAFTDPTTYARPSSASKTTEAASEADSSRAQTAASDRRSGPQRGACVLARVPRNSRCLADRAQSTTVAETTEEDRTEAEQRRRPNARCEPELAPITVRWRALKPMHVGTV